MPTETYELPYEGAKEMLLVNNVESKEFLTGLFDAMYDELPAPKKKNCEAPFLKMLATTSCFSNCNSCGIIGMR